MAKTPKKVSSLYVKEQNKDYLKPEYLEATSGVVGAGQFYSEIENRAPIIDPSQDLGVRFGVNRIQTQQIYKLQDEVGPNGKPVYSSINDKYSQIRFVGEWEQENATEGLILRMADSSDTNNYIEVTFYGTGLNMLQRFQNGTGILDVSVDGVLTTTVDYTDSGNMSAVLNGRNYTANNVRPVVSGLTLGVHTVKIQGKVGNSFSPYFSGFEIVNERTDLLIPKGSYFNDGKLLRLTSEQNVAYDSGFTNEYGTAGTKGGCVSVYLTEEGQIKKDIQYTDASIQYLGSADHSNEEIIAKHYYREFGAGRSNDYSTITSATADRAFTIDDGTTTLVGDDVELNNPNQGVKTSPSDFITITFVGTGLDITRNFRASGVNWQHSFLVDGVSAGNISGTSGNDFDSVETVKIVSGLPYGTHTVKITRDTDHFNIFDFIVYGPKKPEIEDSSVELGSYYLMADFVANTTQSAEHISTGVIRKATNREMVYVGTWTQTTLDPAAIGMIEIQTSTPNSYVEYTFFGTGFDFRWNDGNFTLQFTLDGSTDFSGFTTSHYTTSTATFTPATGAMTAGNATGLNQGLVVSGLTLGLHTIRVAMPSTGGQVFRPFAFDIICPIHSPKLNGPFIIQNTLRVGSQSVGDSRKLPNEKEGFTAFAKGITGSPSTTSNGTIIPANEMNLPIVMDEDGEVDIEFLVNWGANVEGQEILFDFFIDGQKEKFGPDDERWEQRAVNNQWMINKLTKRVFLSKGQHQIEVGYCAGGAVTVTLHGTQRQLTVTKVK